MTDRPCPALRRKPGATEADPCDRPTGEGFICAGCTKHLERVLAELPSWLGELDMAIARQVRVTSRDGGKPTKRFEQPLPYNESAADLLHRVRNELSTAIRGLCESRGTVAPRIDRTPDMATWLVDHVDSIRQDDAAPEMVAWARSLRDAIRWQVDNLGTRFAGPCTARIRVLEVGDNPEPRSPAATDADESAMSDMETPSEESGAGESLSALPVRLIERECGHDLRTRPGDKMIKCRNCGTVYDPVERMAWALSKTRDALETGRVIADALTTALSVNITWSMIRQMEFRGEIGWLTTDDVGRKLYRVGDVVDVVNARITAGKLSDRRERIRS